MNLVVARIIWWSEVASLFLFGIVLMVVFGGEVGPEIIRVDWTMLSGLGVAAIMTAGFTFIIPKIFLDQKSSTKNVTAVDDLRSISRLRLLPLFLSQLIAVYGFIAAFLAGRLDYYWPFAGLSLLLMVIHRPK